MQEIQRNGHHARLPRSTLEILQPGKHYCFVKVTQADGNTLWSAPVWVTVAK